MEDKLKYDVKGIKRLIFFIDNVCKTGVIRFTKYVYKMINSKRSGQ